MLLKVQNLAARRGSRMLFRDLDLQLEAGDLLHLKGANGSGKTTLIRMLAGLGVPAAGRIQWQVAAPAFGYVGHQNAHKPLLTVRENLQLPASGAEVCATRLSDVLELTGLAGLAELPLTELSAGQQRRLALSRLLLQDVAVWLLDEPLSALDRESADFWKGQFGLFREQGGAVLTTGHDYELKDARRMTLAGD